MKTKLAIIISVLVGAAFALAFVIMTPKAPATTPAVAASANVTPVSAVETSVSAVEAPAETKGHDCGSCSK